MVKCPYCGKQIEKFDDIVYNEKRNHIDSNNKWINLIEDYRKLINKLINNPPINLLSIPLFYKFVCQYYGNLGKLRVQYKRDQDYIFDDIMELLEILRGKLEKLPRKDKYPQISLKIDPIEKNILEIQEDFDFSKCVIDGQQCINVDYQKCPIAGLPINYVIKKKW